MMGLANELAENPSAAAVEGLAALTIDTADLEEHLWCNLKDTTRCGGCHNSAASSVVTPMFFDTADINVAYTESLSKASPTKKVTPRGSN